MSPKNSDDEIPNSRTQTVTLLGNRVIAEEISCNEIIRVGPNLTSVPIKKENMGTGTETHIEERQFEEALVEDSHLQAKERGL